MADRQVTEGNPSNRQGRISVSDMLDSPGFCLWQLLITCDAQGIEFPKGTGHIKVDEICVKVLSQAFGVGTQGIALDVIRDAFLDLPVKQAYGVGGSVLKIETIEDRDQMLRNYKKRRDARKSFARNTQRIDDDREGDEAEDQVEADG